MANIIVTLLTNKRTRQTIEALDSVVAAQAGGYIVVEGENETTEIAVNYPEQYQAQNCYVYMKNAKGEYATLTLSSGVTKTFTLPSSMTYRGNTFLTFYAENNGIVTAWLPVVVPVAATGVDYVKAAMASEDIIRQMLDATRQAAAQAENVRQRADNGEFKGDGVFVKFSAYADGHDMTRTWTAGQKYIGVFVSNMDSTRYQDYTWQQIVGDGVIIRYSENADGHNMTTTWQDGQRYIGILIAASPSNNYQDYEWLRFVGDANCSKINLTSDTTTVTLQHDTDKTLTSTSDLHNITIKIPTNANHGFYAGLNFRSGAVPPNITFTNQSTLPLKVVVKGELTENYTPTEETTVQGLFYSDGLNVYAYINEV